MILALIVGLSLAQICMGAKRTVTVKDSLGGKMRVIELNDTVIGGKQVADTLSITVYLGETAADEMAEQRAQERIARQESDRKHREKMNEVEAWCRNVENILDAAVPIAGVIMVFGMPTIILIVVFSYRHKNRKAKYQLAEQAIQHGQPIPEGLFKEQSMERADLYGNRVKGIKNTCLGLALFIFLWALTEEFAIGCIGLIILFNGIGQLAIYYTGQKKTAAEPKPVEEAKFTKEEKPTVEANTEE